MVAVLFEVEQHHTAIEERADEKAPGRAVCERLVLVHQDLIGRFGSTAGDQLLPEGVHEGDTTECRLLGVAEGERVPAHLQDLDRPVGVRTLDRLQTAARWGLRQDDRHC